jgi:hypothetical protein
MFDESSNEVKRRAWRSFKVVTTDFLGHFKAENYESLVEELLSVCKVMECKMSQKINLLDSNLSCFPTWAPLVMSTENSFI